MVLLLNSSGSANLILICSQLLFANGACMGVIASVVVIYMGMEKNSIDDPIYYFSIITLFVLSFKIIKKYINIQMIFLAMPFSYAYAHFSYASDALKKTEL